MCTGKRDKRKEANGPEMFVCAARVSVGRNKGSTSARTRESICASLGQVFPVCIRVLLKSEQQCFVQLYLECPLWAKQCTHCGQKYADTPVLICLRALAGFHRLGFVSNFAAGRKLPAST